MAVDGPAVRKDLFDLVRMFGPANAGGPAQANTNPGANPQPPSQLPPPPTAAEPETTGSVAQAQAPQPQGVRVLPQGTPIQDNSAAATQAGQAADLKQQAIELLPGDADPNLLPPEIRDSWMFRYQQAQRAAQYKAAEEQARWQNVVGGVGNIAQIISGKAPTYQQGSAQAKAPEGTDVGTLYGWKKDYDKAVSDAQAKAKYENLVTRLQRERPDLSPAAIEAISQDPKKLADYGFNQADAKAIADAAKAQISVVKESQGLAGANINDPNVIAETARTLGKSEDYVRAMPIDERLKAAAQIDVARETSQGGARVQLAGKDIEEAKKDNVIHSTTLSRNAQARQALESGAGISGGGYTATEIEARARDIMGRFNITNRAQISNEAVVTSLVAQSAMDLGQKLKGSFSDKDMALLQRAAGGDPSLGNVERARILALSDLASRRAIDENNETLVRAGQRIGEDRSKEIKTAPPLSNAELREVDPAVLRAMAQNPEAGRQLAEFRYGKTTANELAANLDKAIEARLYETPPRENKLDPGQGITKGRTIFNQDANNLLRSYSADELAARREQVIATLDRMDPGNGAATYELILAAKQAGHYGGKAP